MKYIIGSLKILLTHPNGTKRASTKISLTFWFFQNITYSSPHLANQTTLFIEIRQNKSCSSDQLQMSVKSSQRLDHMMTSSSGNNFCVDGPLCGEFTGHQWIPLTKASDAELWCFLWSAPWMKSWVNNREAGDLRSHRPHYDVIVMHLKCFIMSII